MAKRNVIFTLNFTREFMQSCKSQGLKVLSPEFVEYTNYPGPIFYDLNLIEFDKKQGRAHKSVIDRIKAVYPEAKPWPKPEPKTRKGKE